MSTKLLPGDRGEAAWDTLTTRQGEVRHRVRQRVANQLGVTKEISGTGVTKKQARERLNRNIEKYLSLHGGDAERVTFNVLADRWLDSIDATVKPTTRASYARTLRSALRPEIGTVKVARLSRAVLESLLDDLANGRRTGVDARGIPLEGRPIAGDQPRAVLTLVMAFAADIGLVSANPLSGTRRRTTKRLHARGAVDPHKRAVDPDAPDHRHLTPGEVALLDRLLREREQGKPGVGGPRPDDTLRTVMGVMLATGLRIGEVCALRWRDVDLSGTAAPIVVQVRSTYVEASASDGLDYSIGSPKARSSVRDVPGPEPLAALLRDRKDRSQGLAPDDFVFATSAGTPTRPTNLRNALRRAIVDTPLEGKLVPHDLRRTYGEHVRQAAGIEAASKALGHSRIDVTQAYYTRDRVTVVTVMPPTLPAMGE